MLLHVLPLLPLLLVLLVLLSVFHIQFFCVLILSSGRILFV
jgi:hypothetical protein